MIVRKLSNCIWIILYTHTRQLISKNIISGFQKISIHTSILYYSVKNYKKFKKTFKHFWTLCFKTFDWWHTNFEVWKSFPIKVSQMGSYLDAAVCLVYKYLVLRFAGDGFLWLHSVNFYILASYSCHFNNSAFQMFPPFMKCLLLYFSFAWCESIQVDFSQLDLWSLQTEHNE